MEALLGIVDIWPLCVLRYISLLEPNSNVMRNVATFMYGNSVRLSDAMACYNACRATSEACGNCAECVVRGVG